MPGVPIGPVARHVARLYGEGTVSGLSESQLLDRFLARNDAAAFEALVARHGPMVLAVCRRVLRDPHAADDAFQATFLLLVRKAGSIRGTDLLGPWLHRVAYRVSVRLGKAESRRRGRESSAPEAVALAAAPDRPGPELRLALHEALDALPEKLRAPVVLCFLEGRTHDEAARRLHWPIGSVKGRLSRARSLLKDRLSRRGVLVPSGAILSGLAREASAAVPALLRDSTVRAASSLAAGRSLASSGAISATAAALTQEAARSMMLKKLGVLAASVAALFLMVGGAAVVARQDGKEDGGKKASEARSPGPKVATEEKPAAPETDLDRLQGLWELVTYVPDAGSLTPVDPQDAPGPSRIEFRGDEFFAVSPNGKTGTPRTISLDPTTNPKQFTWRRRGLGGEETTRGLYALDGPILSLCYSRSTPTVPPAGTPASAEDFGHGRFGPDSRKEDGRLLKGRLILNYQRIPPVAEPSPEAKAELARLQGSWQLVAFEGGGEPSTQGLSKFGGSRMVIRGNTLSYNQHDGLDQPEGMGGVSPEKPFTLDLSRTPHVIEVFEVPPTMQRFRNSSKTAVQRSSYRLDGDSLLVCSDYRNMTVAPPELVTRPSDGRVLMDYRRATDRHPEPDATLKSRPPEKEAVETRRADEPKGTEPPPSAPAAARRPSARSSPPTKGQEAATPSPADGPTGVEVAAEARAAADQLSDRLGASRDEAADLEAEAERLRKSIGELDQKLVDTSAFFDTGIILGRGLLSTDTPEGRKTFAKAAEYREIQRRKLREVTGQARVKRREADRLESEVATLRARADEAAKRPGKIGTVQAGDILVVEVLEALPGRPISGERIVRPDGTISLGFYGDVMVAGLTRREIKAKVVEHLLEFLNDEALGLDAQKPDPKDPDRILRYRVPPADTDRVFVDDSANDARREGKGAVGDLRRKLDEVTRELETLRRLVKPNGGR